MKNSFRSAVAHLASQPKLLALAAVIAVGANLATGYTGSTQGQISSGGGVGGSGIGGGGVGGDGGGGIVAPLVLTSPTIVDDGDAGFTPLSLTSRSGGFGSDNRFISPNRWSFNNIIPGTFDVYLTWIASPTNSTVTTYTLNKVVGSTKTPLESFTVDQTQTPADATLGTSRWRKLIRVTVAANQKLELIGAIEKNAYIDAVALQRIPFADVTVSKTVPATVAPGGVAGYTVTLRNIGTDAAVGVAITDPVPTGLTFRDVTGATCSVNAGVVLCSNMVLTANQSKILTIRYNVPSRSACNSIITGSAATISTTTPETNALNNQSGAPSTTVTCVAGDLAVDMAGPESGTVTRGDTLLYTVTVTNQGPTALVARIADRIPTGGLTFLPLQSTGCSVVNAEVVCAGISIAARSTATRVIGFTVPATFTIGGVISNTARVSRVNGNVTVADPNPGNNETAPVLVTVRELTHTVCREEACIVVSGEGDNACDPDIGCTVETHTECRNQQCIEVLGSGFGDTCSSNTDCLPEGLFCAGEACIMMRGGNGRIPCTSGGNECRPQEHHMDCNEQNQCVSVPGPGDDICLTNNDCNVSTGNLFITKDSTPVRSRQLLGGQLGDEIFRLRLRADGGNIRVQHLEITMLGETRSLDRLELFTPDGVNPFAFATMGGCANDHVPAGTFCANLPNRELVVTNLMQRNVIVRPRIRTDVNGAVSGDRFTPTLSAATGLAVQAVNDDSGFGLSVNNGNALMEDEVFIGVDAPAANATQTGVFQDVVLSKISNIQNASPDANGTAIPTGLSNIGQFKFSAAAHSNTKDGLNDVVLSSVFFNVNAVNVNIAANSFKFYNKADATSTSPCVAVRAASPTIVLTANASGSLIVYCANLRLSSVNTVIDQGTDQTFVLQASITNPNTSTTSSTLQVSLNDLQTDGRNTVVWFDTDNGSSRQFNIVDLPFSSVFSTRYEG